MEVGLRATHGRVDRELAGRDRERVGARDRFGKPRARDTTARAPCVRTTFPVHLERLVREVPAAPARRVEPEREIVAARAELELEIAPVGAHDETTTADWLPAGAVRIGLTAGASTPNNVVGEVVRRLLALRGRTVEELVA